MSNPLVFPPPGPAGAAPSYTLGPASPFDIKGISAAIDQAASSLRADERGSLTVKVDQDGAGAGLIVRLPSVGPFDPKVLATVTKPNAGRFGWSLSARVGFLVNQPEPKPVRVAPGMRGLYGLLRHRGRGRLDAALTALALVRGHEVRLDP